MWIASEYYPETNDPTYDDHGYEWTPAIGGGFYTKFVWTVTWIPGVGFSVSKGESSQVWCTVGGPTLVNSYDPVPVQNPIATEIPIILRVYINGELAGSSVNSFTTISAINQPLVIGPIS